MNQDLISRLREGGCGSGCDALSNEAADALERLQTEVSALRDDAERWRFYDKAALASWRAKGVERIGEWLTYDAVMQFGSRNAAIDAARGK